MAEQVAEKVPLVAILSEAKNDKLDFSRKSCLATEASLYRFSHRLFSPAYTQSSRLAKPGVAQASHYFWIVGFTHPAPSAFCDGRKLK